MLQNLEINMPETCISKIIEAFNRVSAGSLKFW